MILRNVYWYSTAASDEAAYIIGGYQDSWYSATIAELPRPCWKKTPDDDLFALITGISHWRQSEVKREYS